MKSSRARPFPGRAPGSLCSLDSSLIVKTRRLNHAARFWAGTGAYPIAPAQDYSQRPVSSLTGADGQNFSIRATKKPRDLFRARGFDFFGSSLSHRYPRALFRLFGGSNLGGLLRPIRTEIRAHKLTIDGQTVAPWQGSSLRSPVCQSHGHGSSCSLVHGSAYFNSLYSKRFVVKRKINSISRIVS